MPNDVPVIAHSMAVAHWWPTVLIHCKCRVGEDPTLLLLTIFGQPVACPHCKHKATAVGVTMTAGVPIIDVIVTTEAQIRLN